MSARIKGVGAVYFNGVKVASDSLDVGVFSDEIRVAVELRGAGWNSLLIKSAHNEQPGASRWAIMAALFASDGTTYLPIETDPACQEKGLIVRGRVP